jgi:hypothetical protein
MDQPTYSPTQRIVEASGTLFFKFGDLDSTRPSGSVKIRIETILHDLGTRGPQIVDAKLARSNGLSFERTTSTAIPSEVQTKDESGAGYLASTAT